MGKGVTLGRGGMRDSQAQFLNRWRPIAGLSSFAEGAMEDLRVSCRQILKAAGAAGALGAFALPTPAVADEGDEDHRRRVRWDLINVGNVPGGCVQAGGHASARSSDGSRITVIGSGTFPDVRHR